MYHYITFSCLRYFYNEVTFMMYKSSQQNFRAANELQMSLRVKDFVNVSSKLEIKIERKWQDRCFR